MGTRSRGRAAPVAAAGTLAVCLSIAGTALPSAAIAAPEYANPSPNSPAGSEYALPFPEARNTGQGHHHSHSHGGGGSDSNGTGGTGGSGGTGSGGSGGSGGTGATSSSSPLFGAGIHRATGKSHPSGSAPSKVQPPVMSTDPTGGHRSAIDTAAHTGGSNGPVALLVLFVLLGAAALATVIRFSGRRSPPRGAA